MVWRDNPRIWLFSKADDAHSSHILRIHLQMAILELDIFIIDPSHQTLGSNDTTVRSKLQSSNASELEFNPESARVS